MRAARYLSTPLRLREHRELDALMRTYEGKQPWGKVIRTDGVWRQAR
jgi:hypothetical protein